MDSESGKDFYAELTQVVKGKLEGNYFIFERDGIKGTRMIHYNVISDAVLSEEKTPWIPWRQFFKLQLS